jgi:hypothetical protein
MLLQMGKGGGGGGERKLQSQASCSHRDRLGGRKKGMGGKGFIGKKRGRRTDRKDEPRILLPAARKEI